MGAEGTNRAEQGDAHRIHRDLLFGRTQSPTDHFTRLVLHSSVAQPIDQILGRQVVHDRHRHEVASVLALSPRDLQIDDLVLLPHGREALGREVNGPRLSLLERIGASLRDAHKVLKTSE